MNLDRYEKIDGWQALERFKNGEAVYSFYNNEFSEFVMAGGELYSSPLSKYVQQRNPRTMTIDVIFKRAWYIPKPFDVRKAMIERPNEWVGAYNDGVGWWAVGFDLNHCCVVSKQMPISYPVDAEYAGTDFPKPEQLNICIPIEDVPEEATR